MAIPKEEAPPLGDRGPSTFVPHSTVAKREECISSPLPTGPSPSFLDPSKNQDESRDTRL